MRTLQRLSHQRPTTVDPLARLRRERVEESVQKRRSAWRRVFKSAGTGLALLFVVLGPMLWVRSRRMVCDGLVQGVVRWERAASAARVAEVACQPSQRVQRGDRLLRLEAIGSEEARRPLEIEVEQARLRLDLLLAGGSLNESDPLRRIDQRFDLETKIREALTAGQILFARAVELAREREALQMLLAAEADARAAAREEILGALDQAQAERAAKGQIAAQSKTEAERSERLHAQGLVPWRDVERARVEQEHARIEHEACGAQVTALERRLEAAWAMERSQQEWGEAQLRTQAERSRPLDIEIQANQQSVQRWRDLASDRSLAEPRASATNLAAIEVELARQTLAQAQAKLEAAMQARGEGWITAQSDGVIDRIEVHPGAAVEQGAALVSYVDTNELWVVAYLTEDDARRAEIGLPCRLVFDSDGFSFSARCSSLGAAWLTCPPELAQPRGRLDLRLPARIDFVPADHKDHVLRPGARVQAVFDLDSKPAQGGQSAASGS